MSEGSDQYHIEGVAPDPSAKPKKLTASRKPLPAIASTTSPKAVDLSQILKRASRWREQFNPLRGLNIQRISALLETYPRGQYADLQWLYQRVEQAHPTLYALVERRLSAIGELEWNFKTVPEAKLPEGYTAADAEAQATALRTAYDRICNLREAIQHMALATFRGFSICEKIEAADALTGQVYISELRVTNSWNWVRVGMNGDWFWNPGSYNVMAEYFPQEDAIPVERFIIRALPRHIDWIAIKLFVQAGLNEKNWDAFIEIYGLPLPIIIGPPNVAPEKEGKYEADAATLAEGGSGYLPNGSDVKYPDNVRGDQPFAARLKYLDERLVLVGTGGKLTMLDGATGLGKGPTDAHADVFATLAKSEAKNISEVFQRQFDAYILEEQFPGQPRLAYFELAANEETDSTQAVTDIVSLSGAGYRVPDDEVEERTGYPVKSQAQGDLPNENADGETQDGDATGETPADNNGRSSQDPDPLQQVQGRPGRGILNRRAAQELGRRLGNRGRDAALSADHATLQVINDARRVISQANQAELEPLRQRLAALDDTTDTEWETGVASIVSDLRDPHSPLVVALGKTDGTADVLARAMATAIANGADAGSDAGPASKKEKKGKE